MNPVERAIAAISPKWAAERALYRNVLDHSARLYTAAKGGRRGDGWIAGSKGVNSEIGVAAVKIRDRARELVRNNPYAAGYPGMMASKIIGSGITPRLALTGDDKKEARTKARGIWDRFADNCDPEGQYDFYGLESLVARTVSESGEALIRTIRLPTSAKAAFPVQIVVQECDYIDSHKSEKLDNGNTIIQGVEFDSYGRRVAYWLFPEHPGESFRFTRLALKSERVDAADIDHVFERLRPGQVRGVSAFASVAMKMHDLDDYDDAELMRKKIASCFAAFISSPASGVPSPLTQTASTDDAGRTVDRMSPGMIKRLKPGEEIEFGDPPSADGYTEYHFGQLYAIAAGLGCTFEQLTGNLKGVNMSSIRVGENRFRDLLDHLQWHVYVRQMCRRSWDRVGQVARITGELKPSDPWTPNWITPMYRSPDPQTDIDVLKDAVRANLISPFDAIGLQGYDPEVVLDEAAEFNRQLDARKIISDMDPRNVGRTSTATPAAAKTKQDKPAEAA
jgi:lambda family phage portal protein